MKITKQTILNNLIEKLNKLTKEELLNIDKSIVKRKAIKKLLSVN